MPLGALRNQLHSHLAVPRCPFQAVAPETAAAHVVPVMIATLGQRHRVVINSRGPRVVRVKVLPALSLAHVASPAISLHYLDSIHSRVEMAAIQSASFAIATCDSIPRASRLALAWLTHTRAVRSAVVNFNATSAFASATPRFMALLAAEPPTARSHLVDMAMLAHAIRRHIWPFRLWPELVPRLSPVCKITRHTIHHGLATSRPFVFANISTGARSVAICFLVAPRQPFIAPPAKPRRGHCFLFYMHARLAAFPRLLALGFLSFRFARSASAVFPAVDLIVSDA